MKKKAVDSELIVYTAALEDGDDEFLNDSAALEDMRNKCLAILDEGVSANAHYLLGVYHILKGETDKANGERLKAAYLGHCAAVIDYSSQAKDGISIEILGIVKAMNNAGEHLGSAQEDFDDSLSQLSPEGEEKVNSIAKKVKESMEQYGLGFQW
ncbi:hypothetical protein [Candidatus Symbiobacter mobilis]|uniref:Uncharacterized protein n=1 Tax=Candidatus Symbiobacter mobilis CR TaxID=946483 RepID=U5N7F0_9BURK|nr:hypothetical protein [Candidatus Symbiobacter mobilis]AGX86218.1 hypothetical protein Cenrod_0083 [Candidatus Symbiobacter mobilis CR]